MNAFLKELNLREFDNEKQLYLIIYIALYCEEFKKQLCIKINTINISSEST